PSCAAAPSRNVLGFESQIHPSGNTALLGAKIALFTPSETFNELAKRIEHVSLSTLEGFQDTYVEEMLFPSTSSPHD
ncbi:MAG: C-terminal domain of RACo the domain, partial [Bacteroidetes bacterium]|nr:C-terminal domain of RACo the domain [Bacteroidota bacterium]